MRFPVSEICNNFIVYQLCRENIDALAFKSHPEQRDQTFMVQKEQLLPCPANLCC